ncbi:transmembrane transcriptional regulator [Cupriavidus basilensis OR16]|uniref:Transmembrane transcriptional regulator n=1 Tax=Cupriavidus basilensis OR16 TaxID=1127483 RepID=H1RYE1_9BURK|nr:anti-sigma factor [Cupriavidus basilensis]EHP44632.1 transmembrane transcriptional regulator [Cupriavidus basilensis OR16]
MNDDKTVSSMHSLLSDGSLYHRAPPHLRARVLAGLSRKSRRPPWFSWRNLAIDRAQAWAGGGLAGIAASALVFGALGLVQPSRTSMLGEEILSSHVRSLLSQHPVDVVSTDQHTVKPWFNGRLDYAPPVVDLVAQGFPLAGGRVDYVGHRPVAVLIYRYQQHPIDLYVFPAAGSPSAPVAYSADGYSMARWHQNGMNFWAITDAQPEHLNLFVRAARTGQGN